MEIGRWVRASGFVGKVAAVDDDGTLVLFNPGDRQVLRATPGTVQPLPTGTVRVTVTLDVEVPHGLAEESLRRWTAALIDPVLRSKGRESLEEAGFDTGAFDAEPTVDVRELETGGPGPG
ncbi:hypothetical protein [Euzebya sp.]|uniref:hypothetical protein n=1 Tax=Euzebya sp. TaxID=1971409 RepID=UPI0035147E3E